MLTDRKLSFWVSLPCCERWDEESAAWIEEDYEIWALRRKEDVGSAESLDCSGSFSVPRGSGTVRNCLFWFSVATFAARQYIIFCISRPHFADL